MADLSWREAIIRVLSDSPEAMHYADIAEAIVERELRVEVGATPAATANATITNSLVREEDTSPFIRVDRGRYWLRSKAGSVPAVEAVTVNETSDETGLINAFGMYWSRSNVLWTSTPRILGQQQPGSSPVDFCQQKGVYLLHDGREVVNVGRTTEQPLGIRLKQHVVDRLNGRWDRFSWFGVFPVQEGGGLDTTAGSNYTQTMLIITMEALLIEGLEPRQNRKRGDDFRAVEFLQVEDPEIKKAGIVRLIDELKDKI
jgi:hypothetical protein